MAIKLYDLKRKQKRETWAVSVLISFAQFLLGPMKRTGRLTHYIYSKSGVTRFWCANCKIEPPPPYSVYLDMCRVATSFTWIATHCNLSLALAYRHNKPVLYLQMKLIIYLGAARLEYHEPNFHHTLRHRSFHQKCTSLLPPIPSTQQQLLLCYSFD